MPHNWVKITIHKDKFDIRPACPQVRAGYDPLQVAIEWGEPNKGWTKVTVEGFEDSAGNVIETVPSVTTFERENRDVVKNIHFTKYVDQDDYCKYELHYTRPKPDGKGDETLIVDPTVRLRPG